MSESVLSGFQTEYELRDALIEVLERKKVRPVVEVPFLGRSIDVAYNCLDGSITAIEVKLEQRNIKRALNQAKFCLLGAERVYVCTPAYDISDDVLSEFRNLGVGLIFLKQIHNKSSINYVLPAGNNNRKRKEYKSKFQKALCRK